MHDSLDAETTAQALGVTARTVRRWANDGKLTNVGTPRRMAFALTEVERNTPDVRALRRLRDKLRDDR
jgi:predicted site-specific integrase-resolvase